MYNLPTAGKLKRRKKHLEEKFNDLVSEIFKI